MTGISEGACAAAAAAAVAPVLRFGIEQVKVSGSQDFTHMLVQMRNVNSFLKAKHSLACSSASFQNFCRIHPIIQHLERKKVSEIYINYI